MYCIGNGQVNQSISDIVGALNCMHDQQAVILRGGYESSLENHGNNNSKTKGGENMKEVSNYVVRRLTPL